MADDSGFDIWKILGIGGGTTFILAVIGWGSYKISHLKGKINWPLFISGCIYAGFAALVFQSILIVFLHIPVEHVAPIAAGLGTIAEKLRSDLIDRAKKGIKGKDS